MKVIYPVILKKDGKFTMASIPDCDIDTQGKSLVDAVEMARDAIGLWCVCEQDAGRKLPKPSELSQVVCNAGETVALVDVDINEYDNKPVRKNVTIPSRLNLWGEKHGVNFSQVLKEALETMSRGN